MKFETGKSASIISYNGKTPKIHETVFLCEGVRVIGDVEIGRDSSVWWNCVVRGDVNYVRIGERTNIQDLSMLHVTHQRFPLIIGSGVSIAHSVTVHGCILRDNCLIGMGAVLLDGCEIASNVLVAAGAVVREGFKAPEGVLIAGVPAKIIRDLKPVEIDRISETTDNYLKYIEQYRQDFK